MEKCPHFGVCGGCSSQHLRYRAQLVEKRARLSGLLREALGSRAPEVAPLRGMAADGDQHPWAFRHKAAFVFADAADRRGAVLGHYAAQSQRVVPVTACPVHATRANQVAFALAGHLQRAQVPAAGPDLRGVLRHVIVRTTRRGDEAVAMLVVTRNDKTLRRPVRAFLATADAPDGFYLNIHDRPSPYMLGRQTTRLAGRSHIRERVAGASFLVSPASFFQTNVDAAEMLVTLALEAIDPSAAHVLDLYSGSGLFTVPLALRGHQVTAIEENARAVEDAEANLRLNRVAPDRVRLIAARVEDAVARLRRTQVDAVVLDPPRAGCDPAVIRAVFGGLRPPRAVYVSCQPEALASDLIAITDAGYAIAAVQPVDMFPHTPHIETVVTLERRTTPRPRRRQP